MRQEPQCRGRILMNGLISGADKSVSAIVVNAGQVLLTWRELDGERRLTLPGGAACPGEAPEASLERYVRQQTGVQVRAVTLAGFHFGLESWNAAFNCQIVGGAPSDGAQYMSVDEALRRKDLGELTRLMLAGHERALERDDVFDMRQNGSLYL